MATIVRRQGDWFFNKNTAPAAYISKNDVIPTPNPDPDPDETSRQDFGFTADHIKVKASASMQISFDNKNDHMEIEAVDGWVDFPNAGKSRMFVKGALANYVVIAWKKGS